MTLATIYDELTWRGLIRQSTEPTDGLQKLLSQPLTLYVGFDPTATSLHCGSLMPLMALRRFQKFGHRPIALVGGATGMIGDPSGKSEERVLLSPEILEANVAGLKLQMSRFLDFNCSNSAILVNNYDWMSGWSYINFLRDVGKNFPVNVMLAKDSVKSRLERDDSGMSYTEFSYMLLQAYDFVHLNRQHGCTLQVGGSDQWGNITAGIDLARRMYGQQLYGLTCPLLLTSDGRKMGKTETGALWLDAARTSPYAFYQYWINVEDADVINCLKFLTEVDQAECQSLEQSVASEPHKREAQKRLAQWLTEFVHGASGLEAARRATDVFFGAAIERTTDAELKDIFPDVPSAELSRDSLSDGLPIVDAMLAVGLCKSKAEGKRAVQEGGAYVNNHRVANPEDKLTAEQLVTETAMVLRRGKKNYAVLRFK
jgi:tyrosyl-tRNA synthetase